MSRIIDIIRRVVQQELAQNRETLLGVVTAIFPHESEDDDNNYEANVRLKYEDLELHKVPVAAEFMGMASPLKEGDLVLVQFIDGDLNQPVVTSRFYHADERPPLHKANEMLFEHRVSDGTFNQLRFAADGAMYIQRKVTDHQKNEANAGIKIDPDGNIEIQAGKETVITLSHDGAITIKAKDKAISVECSEMTVHGDLTVTKNGNSTKISGHDITGT